jgi:hypothetical protein
MQDRDGAKLVFAKAKSLGPWLRMERVWADGGYAGKLIAWVSALCQWVLEIVKRNDDLKGFKLLPKRGGRHVSWWIGCSLRSNSRGKASQAGLEALFKEQCSFCHATRLQN